MRAMEQQNAAIPHELSKVFGKAAKPLLQVYRGAAQQELAPGYSVANAYPLPLAAQSSPAGSRGDSSGSAYAAAHSSVGQVIELLGMDACADEPEGLKEL